MQHSTNAKHSQINCLVPTCVPFCWSMREMSVMPIPVSSSTHGRIDWLAYGWNLSNSDHKMMNSTATTPSSIMYSLGNDPAVRSNIWKKPMKLTAIANSINDIWRRRVTIIQSPPMHRRTMRPRLIWGPGERAPQPGWMRRTGLPIRLPRGSRKSWPTD